MEKILDFIGIHSYSLYIVHLAVFSFTQEIMFRLSKYYGFSIGSSLTVYYFVLSMLLIMAFTEILYRCVEKPFIMKAKKISILNPEKPLLDNADFRYLEQSIYR